MGASGGCEGGGGVLSRSYAVSAPADRDASQLYYSYLIISVGGKGCVGGVWGLQGGSRGGGGGFLVVVMAVSAPADRDASQLYYSYLIISVGGRGVWGASGGCKGGLEGGGGGGALVVVMQCLLLLTGMHHSYTTHT